MHIIRVDIYILCIQKLNINSPNKKRFVYIVPIYRANYLNIDTCSVYKLLFTLAWFIYLFYILIYINTKPVYIRYKYAMFFF